MIHTYICYFIDPMVRKPVLSTKEVNLPDDPPGFETIAANRHIIDEANKIGFRYFLETDLRCDVLSCLSSQLYLNKDSTVYLSQFRSFFDQFLCILSMGNRVHLVSFPDINVSGLLLPGLPNPVYFNRAVGFAIGMAHCHHLGAK